MPNRTFRSLHPPATSTIDAVAVFLVERIGSERPVAWYRLVVVGVARASDVSGASVAALGMRTAEELVVAVAKILQSLGDPALAQQMLVKVVEATGEVATMTGVANPPSVDITPPRPTQPEEMRQPDFARESPPPRQPQYTSTSAHPRQPSSASPNEQTVVPPPRGSTSLSPRSSLARPLEDGTYLSEEEKRTIISSSRAKNFESFAAVLQMMATMPVYHWPKKSRHHGELTRALILVAQEYDQAASDPKGFVAGIGQRLRQARATLTTSDAATLQILTATILDAPPTRSALVGIAEIAALAQTPKATIHLLRLCRLIAPPVDLDEFERWTNGTADLSLGGVPRLATVPVRAEVMRRNRPSPSPRPRPKNTNPGSPAVYLNDQCFVQDQKVN